MLEDVIGLLVKIPQISEEVCVLRKEITELRRDSALPQWLTLRECCEVAGLPYESIRRPERRDLQPGHGVADAVILGARRWKKDTVLNWCREIGERAD